MLEGLKKALVLLTAAGERRANRDLGRKATVAAARLLRDPKSIGERLKGLGDAALLHETETGSWVGPEAISNGVGGPFDACDLRHWLALAEISGVPAVPAREVLSLDDAEMAVLSGKVEMPENAVSRSVRKNAHLLEPYADGAEAEQEEAVDFDSLDEKLHAAMDAVPEGWMVRYARCGSSNLKSFAGAGAAGPEAPQVRLGPNLEIGPGWVRVGNRRRVDVSDSRTVEAAAQGPGGNFPFLARPWMEAARYAVSEDPHRHGTAFAGKGIWPAEWRAFVENGKVRGVSWYYGWCGSADQESAAIALQVRDLAQAMADKAAGIGAWPRYMDVEFVRSSQNPSLLGNEAVQAALVSLGRETVSCTLDFIETAEGGLMLLEGGPPNTPFGGGHPCAFAGCGGAPKFGNRTLTDGVAFRTMPQVLLGDPSTWVDGDREGCILSWDEVEELAMGPAPQP